MGAWVVDLDEVQAHQRRQQRTLKSFISTRSDNIVERMRGSWVTTLADACSARHRMRQSYSVTRQATTRFQSESCVQSCCQVARRDSPLNSVAAAVVLYRAGERAYLQDSEFENRQRCATRCLRKTTAEEISKRLWDQPTPRFGRPIKAENTRAGIRWDDRQVVTVAGGAPILVFRHAADAGFSRAPRN